MVGTSNRAVDIEIVDNISRVSTRCECQNKTGEIHKPTEGHTTSASRLEPGRDPLSWVRLCYHGNEDGAGFPTQKARCDSTILRIVPQFAREPPVEEDSHDQARVYVKQMSKTYRIV